MTFLHTLFLPVLFAAAIPILLHLLSRRRLPVIAFSTLEFLRRIQKKKARRVKLKQIILLIIRTLAIIATVLIFTRPALKGSQAAGSAASSEIILTVDDGLNTATETKDGQVISLVAHRAKEILDITNATDRITLIPLSDPDRSLSVGSGQLDLLRDRLDNMESSPWAPRFEMAQSKVDSIYSGTSHFNRETYFISSFYSAGWDSIHWSEAGETEKRFFLPVGPERNANLSIDPVEIKSAILQKGRPVEINVPLRNNSEETVKDALVSVYVEGVRVAQASVDLGPGSVVMKPFIIVPDRTGSLACSVKWEDTDPLIPDNRRWFMLDIPDSIRVFAVVPEGAENLIKAAFSGKDVDFISLTLGAPGNWETKTLSGYDVLLLAGLKSVSAGAAERTAEFVKRGGGVVIFQNTDSDLAGLSRGLWHKLGFSGAQGFSASISSTWGKVDLNHPLFAGMFDKGGEPRSPLIQFAVDLVLSRDDQVIIPFSNGRPFLIERKVEKGRALMYAIPMGNEAGSFIYSGIFAPLMLRSVEYATSNFETASREWETGKSARFVLPLAHATHLLMKHPDGDQTDLIPRPVIGGVEYEVGLIRQTGVYDLFQGDRIVARYAANLPDNQSELKRRDLTRLNESLKGSGIISEARSDLAEIINSARFGREIWLPVAIIFLILLLAESIIGRSGGKSEV